jgi:hypothetical protein
MRSCAITLGLALTMGACASAAAGCGSSATDHASQPLATAVPRPAAAPFRSAPSPTPRPHRSPSYSAGPSAFWSGTDSWPVSLSGGGPYHLPVTGARYGGYIGMAGNWSRQLGCSAGNFLAVAPANSAAAATSYGTFRTGVGVGVYWYEGGPGVDPDYNGSTAEASAWGARQAAWAVASAEANHATYRVLWQDIELPGIAPAPDNGWTSVYTGPCTGRVRQHYVPVALDRAEFDGFAAYLSSHSSYLNGVYSAPGVWTSIFGTGPESQIPDTYEWTYMPETANLREAPSGWCLGGSAGCAEFFGGQHAGDSHAVAWQWSGGGGVSNGYGDYDQIYAPGPA